MVCLSFGSSESLGLSSSCWLESNWIMICTSGNLICIALMHDLVLGYRRFELRAIRPITPHLVLFAWECPSFCGTSVLNVQETALSLQISEFRLKKGGALHLFSLYQTLVPLWWRAPLYLLWCGITIAPARIPLVALHGRPISCSVWYWMIWAVEHIVLVGIDCEYSPVRLY